MPTYARGDYVKVEFQDETNVIGEWMWVRVDHCDDEKQLVFGTLDNEPVNDYAKKEAGFGTGGQIRQSPRAQESQGVHQLILSLYFDPHHLVGRGRNRQIRPFGRGF